MSGIGHIKFCVMYGERYSILKYYKDDCTRKLPNWQKADLNGHGYHNWYIKNTRSAQQIPSPERSKLSKSYKSVFPTGGS